MKHINVIYDYEYDDAKDIITGISIADILLVPDFVCDNVDDVVQKFFNWIDDEVSKTEKSKHPEYWTQLPNDEICMGVNSDHFVKWLNDNYFYCENQESVVIKVETAYNPSYPSAKF